MNAYMKKLLRQNMNASKFMDSSNIHNGEGSNTNGEFIENGQNSELQSYLEKMMNKSGKEINPNEIELSGLPKR